MKKAAAVVCFSVCVSSCASSPAPAPALTSWSAPSSQAPSYSVSAQSAPGVLRIDADLVVRPDLACVPLVVVVEARDAATALAKARAILAPLRQLRVDDVSTALRDDNGAPRTQVTITAVAEAALPTDADALARAAIAGALAEQVWPLAHPAVDDKDSDVVVGSVEPGLVDKEQHRQALLDGWAARVKQLSTSVGQSDVDLQGCTAPPAVQITGGTLEKMGLHLPIHCTIAMK